MTDRVAAQYDRYPYPERDPAEEKQRLHVGSPSHLSEVNHYVFGGGLDPQRPFRALVAGGGTGDGLIMLAQHCVDAGMADAEIVYLDQSAAARRIAEARAAARSLTNIRFVTGSLLDVEKLAPGPHHYIDCCGVLHHLEDPLAGLKTLGAALAEDGGIGVMLYGAYGRAGVYPLQGALRMLTGGLPDDQRLALARRIVSSLPATNAFVRNPLLADHLQGGDAGFWDLLLHARDRPFTVPEVVRLTAAAGLAIAAFPERLRYEPGSYINDAEMQRRASQLNLMQRATVAELLGGNITKHVFYLVRPGREPSAVARAEQPTTIPVMHLAPKLHEQLDATRMVSFVVEGLRFRFSLPELAQPILAEIDGRTDLATIHSRVAANRNPGLSWSTFKSQFDRLFGTLNGFNRMLLRRPGSAFPERLQDLALDGGAIQADVAQQMVVEPR